MVDGGGKVRPKFLLNPDYIYPRVIFIFPETSKRTLKKIVIKKNQVNL